MASNKYQRWKKAELVAECSKRELPIEGTNPVLARRLHRDDERKARRLESGGEPDAVGAQEGMGEEQDVGMGERDAPQGDVQEAREEEIVRNPVGDIGSSVVGRRDLSPFRFSRSASPESGSSESEEEELELASRKRQREEDTRGEKGKEPADERPRKTARAEEEGSVDSLLMEGRLKAQLWAELEQRMQEQLQAERAADRRRAAQREEEWERERRRQQSYMAEVQRERDQMARRLQQRKEAEVVVLHEPEEVGGNKGLRSVESMEGTRLERLEMAVLRMTEALQEREPREEDEWSLVGNRFKSEKAERQWLSARKQSRRIREVRARSKDPVIGKQLDEMQKEVDRMAFRAKVADEWGEGAVDMIDGAEMPRFSAKEKEELKKTKKEWRDVGKLYGLKAGLVPAEVMVARAGRKERVSSHSLRIGGATAAMLGGMTKEQIMTVGGWRSGAVELYIRSLEPAVFRASERMGL
eukprot:TRINITY_DN857_c0_g1_i5.p1 TRINITY_DN857_c0_g1~~TRINITY_DN857_c0_g1_i5.p1  ORF type:complete len:471 (-),score=61.30 TRINITY_DN857_c0_g1_i5:898-2310(-)